MPRTSFRPSPILAGAVIPFAVVALAVRIAPAGDKSEKGERPAPAAAFDGHEKHAKVRWDERFLYVESDGMADHPLMVGITAWQQQVPLPQPYTGSNAWRFPLSPIPAKDPLSAKDRFFRGAIAIAVNGVPIFNPIKNDGRTDTFLAGELDSHGGHSGRADDYHYHIAPVHLTGGDPSKPVAFALDGYAIYGYAEPDGSPAGKLDAFNGHDDPKLGYHYHATKTYPYLNGGFHGEVTEKDGQVDPQPHAHPVREATGPLPGAKITGFETSTDGQTRTLTYTHGGKTGSVRYTLRTDGAVEFVFTNPDGTTRTQTYSADDRRAGDKPPAGGEKPPAGPDAPPKRGDGKRGGRDGKRGGQGGGQGGGQRGEPGRGDEGGGGRPPRGGPSPDDPNRRPWIEDHLAEMDKDADGVLTRKEMEAEVAQTFAGYDRDADGRIAVAERDAAGGVRSAMGGFVKQHWKECDSDGDDALSLGELSAVAMSMFSKADRDGDGRVGGPPADAAEPAPGRVERPKPDGGGNGGGNGGAQRGPSPGVVKPTADDTISGTVYADNWFMLYVNGKPVAVDPIDFLPHNVVTLDFLPEYPMTIAVLAKDNADPRTGFEYGDRIGDAGFVLKFSDGTVTDATWKAKCFFRGPLTGGRVESQALPADWFAPGFDDSGWGSATVYPADRVRPPELAAGEDIGGAKFIWTGDLDLDNTVVFRKRVERPDWKPRWTTKPDLDVGGAPQK